MTPSTDSPPTNTSPYKSRLFNFFNRQRWVWRDRLTQVGHTVQTTVEWGGQILLYPLYLLTQLGRGLSLRLEAAVNGSPKYPKPEELPPCDRPIRNTLEHLQELLGDELEVITQPFSLALNPNLEPTLPTPALELNLPAPALPTTTLETTQFNTSELKLSRPTPTLKSAHPIRAIASALPSRNLVLVDTANQSQDCLTPVQQQTLSQRICWELADVAHHHYLLKVQANQYRIPQQLRQDPQLWMPVQRFWRLMHWLQVSPLAVATNVFGEAEFANVLALPPGLDLPLEFLLSPPPNNRLVVQMDEAIAGLEQQQAYLNAQLNQWWQTQAATTTHPLTKLRKTVELGLGILLGTTDLATLNPDSANAESSVWVDWEELTDHSRDQFATIVPPDASVIAAEMALDLSLQAEAGTVSNAGVVQRQTNGNLESNPAPTIFKSPIAALRATLATKPARMTVAVESLQSPTASPPQPELPKAGLQTTLATTSAQTTVAIEPTQTSTASTSSPPDLSSILEGNSTSAAQATGQQGLMTQRSPHHAHNSSGTTADPLARPTAPPTEPTHQPDWIEVKSQSVGYEVHFLAQVLNAFDMVMLVIEEFILTLWQWFKQLVARLF
ncbi:MAG: hypothetical protein F6J87_13440 [Spirulina sp. SIO3F2]|nr:hypothetical protein [Spirulina sp. SIO3F2]